MLLKVHLKGRMAHFGTAFTNHSSKGSHRIPSKSMMKGMLGAALGIDFKESQKLGNRFSFSWIGDVRSSIITKSGVMLRYGNDVKTVLKSKDWKKGELKRSLDSLEYLLGNPLEAYWYIEVGNDKDLVVDSLRRPVFPLFFGRSECLVSVVGVEEMWLEEAENRVGRFKDLFIGESEEWLLEERMVDTMRDYRKPRSFKNVYTGDRVIGGIPESKFYRGEDVDICMW